MSENFLIWSNEHEAWWRPNSAGYTTFLERAGRYTKDEALRICRSAGHRAGSRKRHIPSELPVREADALACAERIAPRETSGLTTE